MGDDIIQAERLRLRKIDLQTALDIVSLAGMPTHDALGNILPSVWCKHATDIVKENGVLMETDDLRKILLEQMKLHISSRQALILESEDSKPVVQWIVAFTEQWEREYRERQDLRFDISQRIYASMMETYHVLEDELRNMHSENTIRAWKRKFDGLDNQQSFSSQQAIVRALFRKQEINHHLCVLAARLLQKKEVCNTAGTYSSRVQRHDITQLADDAVMALREELEHNNSPFHDIFRWTEQEINYLTRNTTLGT